MSSLALLEAADVLVGFLSAMVFPLQSANCPASGIVDSWWQAFWCPYADAAGWTMDGVAAFAAVIGGFVIWAQSENILVAGGWAALLGGYIIAEVPGGIATRLVSLLTILVIGVFIVIWNSLR